MTTSEPALELVEVTKRFGGILAVSGVSTQVAPGERRAIIGPNGAGKTTLFKLISGEVSLSHGHISLFGRDISHVAAAERVKLGLGRTYQITNVFLHLRVEQNVFLALQGLSRRKFNMFTGESTSEMRERAHSVLDQLRMAHLAQQYVHELGYGQQRQLELALAIASDPKVLLLDEPAAGLSSVERGVMADLVRSLPRDLTIVLIEHDMDLALKLVDSVSCLHNGELLAEDVPDKIQHNAAVQAIYLGAMDLAR